MRWLVGLLMLGVCSAASAQDADEAALLAAVNSYRSEPRLCAQQVFEALPPLFAEQRLRLGLQPAGDLQAEVAAKGYPMASVQAISLSGPRDVQGAMQALRDSFCSLLLRPEFVDFALSREGREWRIVLARPLLASRLDAPRAEGEALLVLLNSARSQARQCGGQAFAAAPALRWSAVLAGVAEGHSRAMANRNFFAHRGEDGSIPGDRVELAGYSASLVGENLAAALDSPQRVLQAWLDSPAHCANLMNARFREAGIAYAVDPKSAAGIYWTALFAAP